MKCFNIFPGQENYLIYAAPDSKETREKLAAFGAINQIPVYLASKIEITESGINIERNAYAGKLINKIELPLMSLVIVVETDEKSFNECVKSHYGMEEFELTITESPAETKIKTIGIKEPESKELDITEASIVVCVGRGIGSKEKIEIVKELAKKLGAAFGATRPLVDIEWVDQKHQIGQTGRNIKADIYICFGVSGAIQHTVGIAKSKTIIAVNTDPEAAIFEIADLGIVGDLFEIIPALMEKLN